MPHQVQRWKWIASASVPRRSMTPAGEPAACCTAGPEWWYTLVNSLRSAGIERAPSAGHAGARFTVPPCTPTEYGTECQP
ncbi:hypothetical protein ALMP_15410 [Streptomyces sp. A012304]|nr:hypothetical protein ALMP_15410 [Streptomyces sp. A012304]